MAHLDLDKVHAAEREAAGEAPSVTLGGETYVLPVKLPLAAAVAVRNSDWTKLCRLIFGAGNEVTVLEHLEPEDLDRIYEQFYGTNAGNSEPSAGSSQSDGKQSRETSDGTSGKTLRPVDAAASGS